MFHYDPALFTSSLTKSMLSVLPDAHEHPDINRFYALLKDYPLRGGKMLRGQFVLLSSVAHGANWQDALRVAAALELFQNWVLVHDDIEDDSDERRGLPALHKQVGMPVALNVGDALHVYMWQLLHEARHLPAFGRIFDEFVWMIQRTAEGQHLDLAWVQQGRFSVSEADYLTMVTLKTAYYTVVCPLRLGALVANHEPAEVITQAGCALGVAFQIRDDVLNLMPDVTYGKEFAGDLYEAKRTLILAHLFAHTSAQETRLAQEALAKPRQLKSQADIDYVLALITRYESLDYAQSVASKKADEGLALLKDAFGVLGQGEAVRELTGLLESLAYRQH